MADLTAEEAIAIQKARREIRLEERLMLDDAQTHQADLLPGSELFERLQRRNNELLKKITHTRELQRNVEVAEELVKSVHQQAIKVNDMSLKYDMGRLIDGIAALYGNRARSTFNWAELGRDAGILFRHVPSFK